MNYRNRNEIIEFVLIHSLVLGLVVVSFVGIFAARIISEVV